MSADRNHREILDLMQGYFDGLYHADPDLLAGIFHPDALYVNTVEEAYVALSLPDYLQVIAEREAPSKTLKQRRDKVLSVEIAGPAMAVVKAEMAMMGRVYTDCLTLTRHQDRWAIIAKIFHYETEMEE